MNHTPKGVQVLRIFETSQCLAQGQLQEMETMRQEVDKAGASSGKLLAGPGGSQ